ncbi:two-component system sensor histidine kinase YesM [Paenibacillus phyllosphaerae]|uniref:histidine kinase n=1 Tax=Paenibacillus phyllosphaerae TaxID=274593 RepID=A0A7W5AZF1_9BACL|nr:sensor histidine kinase [Paenibacillus phyllosphaerae]MBB3111607.1 two-component system sensor histidine kinase YesM [Paenibacillus phyllosphaerae]
MLYSLKSRLITAFVLLFVLSFGVMTLLLFQESRSIIRSYVESSALEKMDEYGSFIDMAQSQMYDFSSLVFNSDLTHRWELAMADPSLSAGEKSLANITFSRFLTQTTNNYSIVSSVFIYREDGLRIGMNNEVAFDPSFKEEAWYQDFKERSVRWVPAHLDPYSQQYYNKPVISLLMPIGQFEPGLSKTVMKVNISSAYLLDPLNRIHLGESGTIFLLNELLGPILSQTEYAQHADKSDLVTKLSAARQKQGVEYTAGQEKGSDIVVYKKFGRTDWILVGFVSEADLYGKLYKLRNSIVTFAILLFLVSVFIAIWLSHGITRPLTRLVSAMRHVQRGDFAGAEERIPVVRNVRSEVSFVTMTFRNMVGQLRSHIQTEFELKLLRQQAEYKALLMQINPHFLFNTLELMSSLAMQKRTDDTVDVIESLGKMLRFSLRISDDVIRLKEELAYVKDYLSILEVRFGDKLQVALETDEGLERVMIIKFILQPLIENAVKYSFRQSPEASVQIRIKRDNDRLRLSVADYGPGIPDEMLRKLKDQSAYAQLDQMLTSRSREIGLGNVLARCKLYYGELFDLRIVSALGEGTVIELILPIREEHANVPSIDRG